MLEKVIKSLLKKLINKEQIIAKVVVFLLGAAVASVGADAQTVLELVCNASL